MTAGGLLATIWDRATARQPVPEPWVVLATGFVALVLVAAPPTWRWVRLGVTTVHEAGHAAVAVLVGRRLQGIRLHSDTSGVTLSRGRPRGPGMVVMLAAGYLAPAVVGLSAALMLAAGHSVGLLWLMLLLLAAMLVVVRNAYGLLVLVVGVAGAAVLSWYAGPTLQSLVAYLVAWLLLLAAPRPLLELLAGGRPGRRGSDPDQLARLTHLPATAWTVLLLLATVLALVAGAATLS